MKVESPRGTVDLLPEQTREWQYVEAILTNICDRFNYEEIRTPIFEHTELFQRGVGDTTDIVQKEMYTFLDRANRSITLRPEGTAGVVRAYITNKLYGSPNSPVKVYYKGPMFRYERPQQGRLRQLHQFGVEVLGSADPAIDAEVISLAMTAYQELGLKSLQLIINSLGDSDSRKAHREALINHFQPHINDLCSDCQSRLEKNPLRILDCKQDSEHEAMATAPSVLEFLTEESMLYFDKVKSYLDAMGITYVVDPTLVRGLDYYNHTAFEIMSVAEGFGAQTTLVGGGRYNGLVEQLGGPETPGIGFGMGIERTLLALKSEEIDLPTEKLLDVYFISLGEKVSETAVKLVNELRLAGFSVDRDYMGRKIKAQFKAADRNKAQYVVILGDDELEKSVVNLRSSATREQIEVPFAQLTDKLRELMEETK